LTNAFFSETQVSEIRDRSSILEVVSDYVSLKKTGRHHKGLCPFHSEKTPSFMVNEEKQIFHCFGCGAGGDVFAFLMKAGNFTFPQALEELAKRYGIALPRHEFSPREKRELARKEVFYQINQSAMEYFSQVLAQRKEGEEGRKYLSQRGLKQEMIGTYRLGYAPDRWDGLVQHLREKKVALEMARELGLIHPKKNGWYDVFRGRIIFPVLDLHHRVAGFGGRLIKEGQPKYLNSPESAIYRKGEILYGLSEARPSVSERDCVIIVEGYFDLLALHQNGVKQSVATLGTALTPHHIRTLKRLTQNVITLFDGDAAGVKATLRSLPLFLEEEVSARAIALPQGEDPDGYLRKGNLKAFEKKLAEAAPLMDFFFDWLMKTQDPRSIDGKIRIAREGISLVGRIPDRIRRDFYVKALADRLDIEETILREMLHPAQQERLKREGTPKVESPEKEFPKSEELIVRLMVHSPGLIRTVSEEGIVECFESPILRKIADRIEAFYEKNGRLDMRDFLGSLPEDLQPELSRIALQEKGLEEGSREKMLQDCIQKIRQRRLKKDKTELLKKMREAERQERGKGLETLLAERQKLIRTEKELWKAGFLKEVREG
jgi:DNA primase